MRGSSLRYFCQTACCSLAFHGGSVVVAARYSALIAGVLNQWTNLKARSCTPAPLLVFSTARLCPPTVVACCLPLDVSAVVHGNAARMRSSSALTLPGGMCQM